MTREEFLSTFPELIAGYKASDKVLGKIGNIALLMVIGPSGVGKTTLMNRLGLPYVASDITRPRRPEEKDGVDYNFRSDYDAVLRQIKAGQFVQTAVGPGGDFYSTLESSYPEEGTAVMAVVADVVPVFRNLGFKKTLSAFITPPSYDEWMRRISSHELNAQEKEKRLAEARRSFSFALNDKKTDFILNDDIEAATTQLKDLVKGKIDNTRGRQARQASQEILNRIN